MNPNPQYMPHGGGFGFRDGLMMEPGRFHHDGHPALAWATFALLVLLTLSFFALALSQWSARRGMAMAGGPGSRRFMLHRGPGGRHEPDPLDVLRHRYARGEISREEFVQATADLGGAGEAPTVEGPPS